MKDNGVVPKDKLSVTTIEHDDGSVSKMVKSPVPGGETPVFTSVTVTPSKNLKEFTVTPYGTDGHPLGDEQKATPSSPTTPTTLTFSAPTPADHLIVVFHPSTPGEKTTADLVSVVACMPDEGNCFYGNASLMCTYTVSSSVTCYTVAKLSSLAWSSALLFKSPCCSFFINSPIIPICFLPGVPLDLYFPFQCIY